MACHTRAFSGWPSTGKIQGAAPLAEKQHGAPFVEHEPFDGHVEALGIVHVGVSLASPYQFHNRSHQFSAPASPRSIFLRISSSGQPVSEASVDASCSRRLASSSK